MIFSGPLLAQTENSTEAKVEIVKYSDYQCPACKYYVPIEEQLKAAYGDDLVLITRHFPLNMHEYAQLASRAAEAARAQGKYQEMHDMIFAGQEQWSRGNAESMFIGYANSLDLDIEKFRADLNSADMQRIIMADKRQGMRLNVNSTPTYFINGEKVERTPRTFEEFKALVDQHMN